AVIYEAAGRCRGRKSRNRLKTKFISTLDDAAKSGPRQPCLRNQVFALRDFELVARSDLRAQSVRFMKEAPDKDTSIGQSFLQSAMSLSAFSSRHRHMLLFCLHSGTIRLTGHRKPPGSRHWTLRCCAISIVLMRTSETRVRTVETAAMTGVRLKSMSSNILRVMVLPSMPEMKKA